MTKHTVQQQKKRMSTSMKVAFVVIPVVIVAVVVLIIVQALNQPRAESAKPGADGTTSAPPLVAKNSHVLDDAGKEAPVFVEFLDFECEACGGVYPVIEDIRKQYKGKITFVARYFNTNHQNSMNAALAVEAASKQGKFEEMYSKLFESQPEWTEKQDSQADRIRGYAEGLGLDMAAYDAAVADPATEARIMEDHNAGLALGVQGTPTFFLDGKKLQPQTVQDLTDALDAAIAKGKTS